MDNINEKFAIVTFTIITVVLSYFGGNKYCNYLYLLLLLGFFTIILHISKMSIWELSGINSIVRRINPSDKKVEHSSFFNGSLCCTLRSMAWHRKNMLVITDLGELQFQYIRGCNDALC